MPLSIFSNAGTYIFIKFFSQGLVFLSTIALAGLLKLEDFAIIGTHLLITAFLLPIINLQFHRSLERFFFMYEEGKRSQKIFTITVASFIVTTVIIFIAYILLAYIFELSFYNHTFLVITLLSALFQSPHHITLVIMRCEKKIVEYGVYSLLTVILTQSFILSFVYVLEDMYGFFYGSLLGSVVSFFIWVFWLRKKIIYKITSLTEEIKYILPNLPLGVLEAVQQTFDRIFLQSFVSGADFATYSFAQRVSGPIKTTAAGARSVTYPIIYSLKKEEDVKKFLSEYTNMSVAFFGITANLMILAIAFLFEFILKPEYKVIFPIFLVCILGYFFKAQEVLMAVGADVKMKLSKNLKVLTPVVILQVSIACVMTYGFGLWGAALAFVINCSFRLIAMSLLGQKLVPREINKGIYLLTLFISIMPIGAFLISYLNLNIIFGIDKVISLVSLICLAKIVQSELSNVSQKTGAE